MYAERGHFVPWKKAKPKVTSDLQVEVGRCQKSWDMSKQFGRSMGTCNVHLPDVVRHVPNILGYLPNVLGYVRDRYRHLPNKLGEVCKKQFQCTICHSGINDLSQVKWEMSSKKTHISQISWDMSMKITDFSKISWEKYVKKNCCALSVIEEIMTYPNFL